MGIKYAAVFPVPFFALAMIDSLLMVRGIDYYWIGVGLKYYYFVNASTIFSFKPNSVNDWYLVA